MRLLIGIVLVIGFVLPVPAWTEPVSVTSVGDVTEPMVSISEPCGDVPPCLIPGPQPGAYVFSSDRPRVLGQGTYQGAALDVWVPPGASTLVTAPGATVTRRPVPAEMTLTSPEFDDGESIPARFSCDGDTTSSPALQWGTLPQGTVELAIVVEDPDTPVGTFVHWVMYGIDPSLGGLAEGEQPPGSRVGSPWRGPCPPNGDPVHRYIFTLYAVSAPTALEAGASPGELRAAITGTLLDQARLTGTYAR